MRNRGTRSYPHVKEWARILGMSFEDHTILLPNTTIVFQKKNYSKERLNVVKILKNEQVEILKHMS
jgi:hypothetical protein